MIPRIDLRQLLNVLHPDHHAARAAVREGAMETGFLTVHGTSLSAERMQTVLEAYKAFFALPAEVKSQWNMAATGSNRGWGAPGSEQVDVEANPDFKQVFDCGFEWQGSELPAYSPNLWPDRPAEFRSVLEAYYNDALVLAMDILCAVVDCIGSDCMYFRDKFDKPMALLRGNYYPPRPADAGALDFGIAQHTDYGCLTLLATDGTAGLEVRTRDGGWVPVSAPIGEFVINFGEMLEMWTDGKIVATPHRVVGGNDERLSVPLFFNPRFDTNVAPQGASKIIRAVDHLQSRFDETYLHLRKDKA
jgi:isopenicillin N synthase-like dioxygenase